MSASAQRQMLPASAGHFDTVSERRTVSASLADKAARRRIRACPGVFAGLGAASPQVWAKARMACPDALTGSGATYQPIYAWLFSTNNRRMMSCFLARCVRRRCHIYLFSTFKFFRCRSLEELYPGLHTLLGNVETRMRGLRIPDRKPSQEFII
jgi:hypothetical protein